MRSSEAEIYRSPAKWLFRMNPNGVWRICGFALIVAVLSSCSSGPSIPLVMAGAGCTQGPTSISCSSGADLNGANLISVDLLGAELTGVNLRYARLDYANLTGANLTDARLNDANLTDAI